MRINLSHDAVTFVYFFSDCYNFHIDISGAADIDVQGYEPTEYSFFDEISVRFTGSHTCDYVSETSSWRHVRYAMSI